MERIRSIYCTTLTYTIGDGPVGGAAAPGQAAAAHLEPLRLVEPRQHGGWMGGWVGAVFYYWFWQAWVAPMQFLRGAYGAYSNAVKLAYVVR